MESNCRKRNGVCTCAGPCALDTKPSDMPVPNHELLRSSGKLLSAKDKEGLIKESGSAAAKMLYMAFHTALCESHIDLTFDIETGQRFRLKFEKIDPLI